MTCLKYLVWIKKLGGFLNIGNLMSIFNWVILKNLKFQLKWGNFRILYDSSIGPSFSSYGARFLLVVYPLHLEKLKSHVE